MQICSNVFCMGTNLSPKYKYTPTDMSWTNFNAYMLLILSASLSLSLSLSLCLSLSHTHTHTKSWNHMEHSVLSIITYFKSWARYKKLVLCVCAWQKERGKDCLTALIPSFLSFATADRVQMCLLICLGAEHNLSLGLYSVSARIWITELWAPPLSNTIRSSQHEVSLLHNPHPYLTLPSHHPAINQDTCFYLWPPRGTFYCSEIALLLLWRLKFLFLFY